MAREHRVQSALAGTAVPVPRMVGLCEDPAVAGAPFYVMEYVEGRILRDPRDAAGLDTGTRHLVARAMIETLAELHAVEPAAVGLEGFGRPEGFLARQLRRWWTQFEGSRSRDLPGIENLHESLTTTVPQQRRSAVVHGDYRLDNLVLRDGGAVRAVLDWEMATLGDPLADVGLLLAYWEGLGGGHGGIAPGLVPGPGSGFPPAGVLVERYARARGADVDDLAWYVAFGYFKIAVILEGIHRRHALGRTLGEGFEGIGAIVPPLVGAGLRTLDEGV
jgi:aminoglycoside phosphotransferase (APT) family kinase protein